MRYDIKKMKVFEHIIKDDEFTHRFHYLLQFIPISQFQFFAKIDITSQRLLLYKVNLKVN